MSYYSHIIRIVDRVTICVETSSQGIGCFLEEEFIELIHMNPLIVSYLTFNETPLPSKVHNIACHLMWLDL